MYTFAVIENGVVENCITADSLQTAEAVSGKTCIEYFLVSPGWTYADGRFTNPNAQPMPEESEPGSEE
jgi:hypothetical protein